MANKNTTKNETARKAWNCKHCHATNMGGQRICGCLSSRIEANERIPTETTMAQLDAIKLTW